MKQSPPVRTVAPTMDVVTLDEAKRHLNVAHSADDTLITLYIKAATELMDGPAGIACRALITQTWKQNFCNFAGGIRLEVGPVASITTVKYYDTQSTPVQQTLSNTVYELRRDSISDFVALKYAQAWPSYTSRWDAVEITWVAGETQAALPEPIRAAALLIIGNLYENREEVVVGAIPAALPMGVWHLLAPFRKQFGQVPVFMERDYVPWL